MSDKNVNKLNLEFPDLSASVIQDVWDTHKELDRVRTVLSSLTTQEPEPLERKLAQLKEFLPLGRDVILKILKDSENDVEKALLKLVEISAQNHPPAGLNLAIERLLNDNPGLSDLGKDFIFEVLKKNNWDTDRALIPLVEAKSELDRKKDKKIKEDSEKKGKEEQLRKLREDTERRMKEELERRNKEENEKKLKEEQLKRFREEEQLKKLREEDQLRKLRDDEARRLKEEEQIRKLKEEEQLRKLKEAEEERKEQIRKLKEEEMRRKLLEEEKLKKRAEEEMMKRKAEEEARRKYEEEYRRKNEEESRRRSEEEYRRKAEEDRKKIEEERKKMEEERKKMEEMREEEKKRKEAEKRKEEAEKRREELKRIELEKRKEELRKLEEEKRKIEKETNRQIPIVAPELLFSPPQMPFNPLEASTTGFVHLENSPKNNGDISIKLTVKPEHVEAGDNVNIIWEHSDKPNAADWIALYHNKSSQDKDYISYHWVPQDKTGSLSVKMPSKPGSYVFKYFVNKSYVCLASSNVFKVGPSYRLTPTVIGTLEVSVNIDQNFGIPSSSAWIGMYEPDKDNKSYHQFHYLSGKKDIIFIAPKSGRWEFRVFPSKAYEYSDSIYVDL